MSDLKGPSTGRDKYSACLADRVSSLTFKLQLGLAIFPQEIRQEGILLVQMKTSNLLVQDLGESVYANLELASSLLEFRVFLGESLVLRIVEENLGKGLVGERARHDERRVASGTSQVNETTLSQENDTAAILHVVAVDLRLDGNNLRSVGLEPGNVNFAVEMTDVLEAVSEIHKLQIFRFDTYCRQWSHPSWLRSARRSRYQYNR